MAPTVIPFSVRRWVAVFVGSAVFVAIGVWMVRDDGSRVAGGWAGIVFFGFCALVAAWQLIRRRPDLVISDEGLTLYGRALIRWDDVESVGARTVRGRREVLQISLRDPDALPLFINATTAGYALSRIVGLMRRHNPALEITAHPAPPKSGGFFAHLTKGLIANRRKVILHAIGWPVAIVATVATMAWWANHTGHISTARVGKCIAVAGDGYKVVGCDRPEAAYRVTQQFTKQTEHDYATRRYCPDSDMQYYYAKDGRGVVWCFTPLPGTG